MLGCLIDIVLTICTGGLWLFFRGGSSKKDKAAKATKKRRDDDFSNFRTLMNDSAKQDERLIRVIHEEERKTARAKRKS